MRCVKLWVAFFVLDSSHLELQPFTLTLNSFPRSDTHRIETNGTQNFAPEITYQREDDEERRNPAIHLFNSFIEFIHHHLTVKLFVKIKQFENEAIMISHFPTKLQFPAHLQCRQIQLHTCH